MSADAGDTATPADRRRAARRTALSGLCVPVAEAARLARQPRRVTLAPDRVLGRVAVAGPFVVACLMLAVVPWGADGPVPAHLSVGVVWFNAMDVVLWALVWLAGWAPNSAWALVGGYRFLAQALAYELPLMFALTAPAAAAGSLRMSDVVEGQQGLWYGVWMPVAFVVFCAGVAGFSVWGPFAAPVGADLAGGVLAEPSGADRALLLAGRYALLVAGAAVGVTLFLGGPAGPVLPGWGWVVVKTGALLAVLSVVRRRLGVLRVDRVLQAGWLVALPAVLVQLLAVAVVAS